MKDTAKGEGWGVPKVYYRKILASVTNMRYGAMYAVTSGKQGGVFETFLKKRLQSMLWMKVTI